MRPLGDQRSPAFHPITGGERSADLFVVAAYDSIDVIASHRGAVGGESFEQGGQIDPAVRVQPDEFLQGCHSAIGRPYFFSMDGK